MKAFIMVRLTGNKVSSMETQAAAPCARVTWVFCCKITW